MKAIGLGLAGAIVLAASASAETEAELREAIKQIEGVKLGGSYKIDPVAYACADKGKLMFVERMASGDAADQSTAQLIGSRDCTSADEEKTYTRCESGGFVFPRPSGRKVFSGYCVLGTTGPVLYVRDDAVTPAK